MPVCETHVASKGMVFKQKDRTTSSSKKVRRQVTVAMFHKWQKSLSRTTNCHHGYGMMLTKTTTQYQTSFDMSSAGSMKAVSTRQITFHSLGQHLKPSQNQQHLGSCFKRPASSTCTCHMGVIENFVVAMTFPQKFHCSTLMGDTFPMFLYLGLHPKPMMQES